MRKLKTVVKLFIFPAACFACVVWTAVFVIAGFKMPHQNIGQVMLLVFAGLGLMLPWLVVVLAMGRRIGWTDDLLGGTHPADGPVHSGEDSSDS